MPMNMRHLKRKNCPSLEWNSKKAGRKEKRKNIKSEKKAKRKKRRCFQTAGKMLAEGIWFFIGQRLCRGQQY